jgi:hypothetical protein
MGSLCQATLFFPWLSFLSQGFDSRNPLPDEYAKTTIKYADILEWPPYNMLRSAAALKALARGTLQKEPPLDISACDVRGELSLGARRANVPSIVGAMAVEPNVSAVAVLGGRAIVDYVSAASNEGRFVYGLAADLVRHHGYNLAAYIETYRACWSRLHVTARVLAADVDGVPQAGDDMPMEIDEDPMELVVVR